MGINESGRDKTISPEDICQNDINKYHIRTKCK